MKRSFVLDKSAASIRTVVKTQYQEQPFSINLKMTQSLHQTQQPQLWSSKHQSEENPKYNKSIFDDFKLEDSRVLNTSNSQTLSVKKKPLNLSNSSGTPSKAEKNQKQDLTTDTLFRHNLSKWHRRINTFSKQSSKQKQFYQQSSKNQQQTSQNHIQSTRRYSFRTVKTQRKKAILENPFQQQPTAKQLSKTNKTTHSNFKRFTSKYSPSDTFKSQRQKTEHCVNEEADRNLKEFLKYKLGLGGTTNDENSKYY